MKIFCAILALFCCAALLFTAGVAGSYFNWPITSYVIRNLDTLKSAIEYRISAQNNFLLDESILTKKGNILEKFSADTYTLVTLRYVSKAYLINEQSQIIHTWNLPYQAFFPPRKAAEHSIYLEKALVLPNGDLLATYTGWGDTPYGYGLVKTNKDSNVIWIYAANTHHDIFIHPDTNNVYVLSQEFLKWRNMNVLADHIDILSADGILIDKISILDAFNDSEFKWMLEEKQSQGTDWDPFHTNSIDVITPQNSAYFPQFSQGQILVSLRNMNTIAVIDPSTRKVVWGYRGNILAQHSAHFTHRGTIMLLDNQGGGTQKAPQSRILEINPTTMHLSVRYAGTRTSPFYTCAYGRIEPRDNGTILITETLGSRVFEIDADGNITWQYKLKPFFQPRIKDIAPFGKNENRFDPDFLCAQPNLATAIVSAQRYTAEQLPFLKEGIH